MDINNRRFWILRLLILISMFVPLMGLIIGVYCYDSLCFCDILFYNLGTNTYYLFLLAVSTNYIRDIRLILPHYNYITTPISNKELLIRDVKCILTHKYTCYIVVVSCIMLIISDVDDFQKVAIGVIFILLLFFFTTFYVFFCNSDFKFTWIKNNCVAFNYPFVFLPIAYALGNAWLIGYAILLFILSILLSAVYYRKAIKAMQQPFIK